MALKDVWKKLTSVKQIDFSNTFGIQKGERTLFEKFKGKVIEEKIRFPEELGEKHPFDFTMTEGVYLKFGPVSGIVDRFIDFVWGPGFFAKSDNPRAQEIIEQWMQDVNFDFHGRRWVKEAFIKGTGFLEMGGTLEEMPQGVKNLNANHMFIERTKTGEVTGINQFIGKIGKFDSEKVIKFKPFELAILPINQLGDSPYGWGMIFPNLETVNNILQNSKDLHMLMKRKANTPIDVTVGNKEDDIQPTQGEIDNISTAMTFMNNKTEWVHDANVELKVLDFGNFGDKFTGVMDVDFDMLFFGFQMPEVVMGRGSIPEGLAQVQLEVLDRKIRSIQVNVEKVIEEQIFRRVLQANGIDAHVEFEWGEPSNSEVNKKIAQFTELLKILTLTPEFRDQIELRLAPLIGINEEEIISAQDEREEEEEEEEQPLVPGQNQALEFYEGELISDESS